MLQKLNNRKRVGRTFEPSQTWQGRLRSIAAKLWRWKWRALALAAVCGAIGYFSAPLVLGPVAAVDPVIRADFLQTVVASGHVEAPFRVNIGSQITGVVVSVPVDEGQVVKAGDTLVELDDHEARAAVVAAEGAIAQNQARLRQIRELTLPSAEEALKQAQATLLNAQRSYDRAEKLAGSGYGTQAALDDARRMRDVALAQVRGTGFQVFTNRPGGSDYVMAETQLKQAEANLATARSRLGYTQIIAPRDGVLISRNVERGYVVQPSNVLMKLSPSGDTLLVVQVDEKNLGSLALHQRAAVSADAFPKQVFPAEVVFINPGVELDRASVEVKLRPLDPPDYLTQDMTVSVDIEVARRPNTLIAPAADIYDLDGPHPWVLKVDGRHARRQLVKVGLVSAGNAEILEGLSEKDLLLPATGTAIKDGSRIRPSAKATGRSP